MAWGSYGGYGGSGGSSGSSGSSGGGMAWLAAVGQGFGQYKANQRNRQQSKIMRSYQERMSNTAIQRRMADMQAAGINPVLAARFDATTPPGAMATMQNVGGAAVEGYSSVKSVQTQKMLADKQLALMDAEIELKGSQAGAAGQQAELYRIQGLLTQYNADVKEGAAFVIQGLMSLLPAEVKNDPDKAAEWVLREGKKRLDQFMQSNGVKDSMEFLQNVATIVKTLVGSGADRVTGVGPGTGKPPARVSQEQINKLSRAYERDQKPWYRGGKGFKGTFKQYVRKYHSHLYFWSD